MSVMMERSVRARAHSVVSVKALEAREQPRCASASVTAKRRLNRVDIYFAAWLIVDSASGGQHVFILVLGLLALIEFGTRPDHPFPASLASATPTTHQRPSSSTKVSKHQASPPRELLLLPSIALASLFSSLPV